MKKLIITSVILFITSCTSLQLPLVESSILTKSKIIENLNNPKDQLYITANKWMISVFNNAESVIQFSDKDSGTITGKYLLQGSTAYSGGIQIDTRIFAIIDIQLQDNRAKITIKPAHEVRANDQGKQDILLKIDTLISNFENSIKQQKEDW